MKKILFVAIVLLLPLCLQGQDMDIAYLLQETEKEIGDLTTVWSLTHSESFKMLEDSADAILDESLIFLQSKDLSWTHKMILLLAVHNVDFTNYKDFLNKLAVLYVEGSIDEDIMNKAIIPFDWSYLIRENYRDIEVRKALNRCLEYEKISVEFQTDIEDVLNGKAWRKYHQSMIRLGYISPPFSLRWVQERWGKIGVRLILITLIGVFLCGFFMVLRSKGIIPLAWQAGIDIPRAQRQFFVFGWIQMVLMGIIISYFILA